MGQDVFQAYLNSKHNIAVLKKRLDKCKETGNKDKIYEAEKQYNEALEAKKRIENSDTFKNSVANIIKGMLNEE
ncbi:hypothetical protein [Clostridium massiliodielmoense]|uniref:hypothetical protein n=1 Tax=Clostridium massiliodielmoense TaxID=1776385 RepID=UPI000166869C|nr:hypothetical protein [Clostridium massiliodielmoense]EDS77832.1 conserved hypothetical protein [Clostridium botulinum C str. Eklund]KEH93064.1 hypothetical protein Z962_10735 [Clostridium botulinum C/D str. BKT12695]NEZ50087.1 hypothetical protein [Clostridium botulinum]